MFEIRKSAEFAAAHALGEPELVELVMELEDEFEMSIPDEEAEKITTVQLAVYYINAHSKSPAYRLNYEGALPRDYTIVYFGAERVFCPWSISEAESRLPPHGFLRAHRSYLVNPAMVATFVRSKDKGRLPFNKSDLPPVPVSRSHLKVAQTAFG